MTKYCVTALDTFMSGWGNAAGTNNYFHVYCETEDEADQIFRAMQNRSDMVNAKIWVLHNEQDLKATLDAFSDGLISTRLFSELGGIWKKDFN